MKKFVVITALITILAASFALPAFAEEGCDSNTDYLTLGEEQLENEDFNGALHSANCGLSFGNNLRDFYYLRADVYCDMGNAEASIADFTTVIELNPTADAYNYRGWAYYMYGDLNAAMNDYNRAIAIDPDLHYAYNNRGLAWQAMGYLELAREDYEKAIELGMVENWAETNLYNVNFEINKLNES
jgi:tetratricopeptide (TPR) repeat protein